MFKKVKKNPEKCKGFFLGTFVTSLSSIRNIVQVVFVENLLTDDNENITFSGEEIALP